MGSLETEINLVGVYGSLKRGFYNHGFLGKAAYVGESWLSGFRMHSLGFFPGVVFSHDVEEKVLVEWYQVDDETLAELDVLEGFQAQNTESSIYLRYAIESPFGAGWIYLYNQPVADNPQVNSGNWREEGGDG